MRIKVVGDCAAAKVLRGYLRKSDCALVDKLADYTVYLDEAEGPVTVDSIDSLLERNALNLMQELGVPSFLLLRADGVQSDSEIRISYPSKYQRAVELGLYRTLTHEKRDRRTKLTKAARKYAVPVVLWFSLVLLSSLAHSDPLPRGFNRTYPILFQPTNFPIIRFWDGAAVQNATFTSGSINVNCTGGCGGAATFTDNSAFTFNTTSITNIGAVVDDVATNTVAENSAGTPRMNTNRILYFNPRNNAGTEIPFPAALGTGGGLKVDGSGTALPISGTVTANQGTANATPWNENVAQIAGTNTVTAAAGVQKVGIVGNANAIIDVADNTAPPANEVAVGLLAVAIDTQPTNKTGGNLVRQLASTEGVTYVQEGNSKRFSCFVQAVTVTTQCQAAPAAGLRAYVTGANFSNQAATVQTLDVVFGTGTNCATGITALTHKWQMGTNATTTSPQSIEASFFTPLIPTAANAICVRPSAATAFGATLTGFIAP